jgi:outer membrane lipopolysaccharide assembly protein LptE/RlpB
LLRFSQGAFRTFRKFVKKAAGTDQEREGLTADMARSVTVKEGAF